MAETASWLTTLLLGGACGMAAVTLYPSLWFLWVAIAFIATLGIGLLWDKAQGFSFRSILAIYGLVSATLVYFAHDASSYMLPQGPMHDPSLRVWDEISFAVVLFMLVSWAVLGYLQQMRSTESAVATVILLEPSVTGMDHKVISLKYWRHQKEKRKQK